MSLKDVLSVVISVLALAVALGGLIAPLATNAQTESHLRRDKAEQALTAFLCPLKDPQKATKTIYDDPVRMTGQDSFESVPACIQVIPNPKLLSECEWKHGIALFHSMISNDGRLGPNALT